MAEERSRIGGYRRMKRNDTIRKGSSTNANCVINLQCTSTTINYAWTMHAQATTAREWCSSHIRQLLAPIATSDFTTTKLWNMESTARIATLKSKRRDKREGPRSLIAPMPGRGTWALQATSINRKNRIQQYNRVTSQQLWWHAKNASIRIYPMRCIARTAEGNCVDRHPTSIKPDDKGINEEYKNIWNNKWQICIHSMLYHVNLQIYLLTINNLFIIYSNPGGSLFMFRHVCL